MLQLDTNKLMNDLYSQLYKALEQVAKHDVEYMIYELVGARSTDMDIENWKRDVIDMLQFIGISRSNEICIEFGLIKENKLITEKAMILNYGTGELLDINNPYFQQYMNSKSYNQNSQVLNPIHFFENALVFIIPEMDRTVQDIIAHIDFSKYLMDS